MLHLRRTRSFADVVSMSSHRLQYLTENDWVLIQAKAQRKTFKLGEEIVRQGEWPGTFCIIRRGEAAVELGGTGQRAIVAWLGVDDVCGEISFLEQSRASAAVVARDEEVEVEEISAQELQKILEAFPRLASRFYRSLALVIAQRLRVTSGELAREMGMRDRKE